ncbi:cytochrome b/b6 domain-containing protein [Microbacterium fluvii]|uniref:Cytochrome b/b6 domain-containing protein n=1 Tax=Microbacterium fluvii TaxID=415215 RepID=A0ABW2HDN7_9MICO
MATADAAESPFTTTEAAAAAPVTVRRGLPRVPGGEPWPPASFAAVGAAASASVSAADPPAAVAASAPDTSRDMAASVVADAAQRREVPYRGADGEPQAADAADAPAVRRGLPRVAGGEPWPPAEFTARRPGAAASAVASTVVAGTETTSAAQTTAPAAPAAPAAAPAAPQTPAELAGSVAAEAAQRQEVSTRETETTAVATVREPLPFTPTVWAGANAFTRPAPKPEPRRIGPFTRLQWAGAVIIGGAGMLFAAAMVVFFVRWFISLEFMQDFLTTYPGEYHLPETAPVGLPAWIGWQHFFNVFLMVLIIRSGLQVRNEKRPSVFWAPKKDPKGKISLALWFHQGLDILWLVNGVVFVALLFVTGQWMRIVPTSWEVFPNAISAALQYVSLDWPTENGWVNYNSLQQLAYFTTVFIAAPLAAITGYRMTKMWPKNAKTLSRIYPVEWARAVHFPVMIFFVLFIIVHVTLVFATGALRNLNHMYGAQDAVNWTGFWIFAASMLVIAGGWVAARPLVLAPIARLFGNVSGR